MSNEIKSVTYLSYSPDNRGGPSEAPRLIKPAHFSLGNLLKLYRERANPKLTRERLAASIGVSQKTIVNWENDISLPTSYHLKKMLEVYLQQALFTPEQELNEAQQLWQKRQDSDDRNTYGEFDAGWFTQLVQTLPPNNLSLTGRLQPRYSGFKGATITSPSSAQPKAADNWPLQLTSFVGRADELNTLSDLIQARQVRLLTLTGLGGVGKTRLALQLGQTLEAYFKHGFCVVSLADVNDLELIPSLLLETLGYQETNGETTTQALQRNLRDKQLLLLLDNFEHVLTTRTLVADLLRFAPNLTIIVTSRTPLGIYGEQEYEVSPLNLPTSAELAQLARLAPPDLAAALEEYPALQLLVERIRLVKPAFQLTADNALVLARIALRLDGLPLALELAAAQVKIFSPAALLQQLESSAGLTALEMGTASQLGQSPRQQTLRQTLDWSYNLLDPAARQLLRRMAIFRGGSSLEAIEAVCRAEDAATGASSIYELLRTLCFSSLVKVETTTTNEARFGLLQTVQDYALEQLQAADEETLLRRRHAAYYLALAETAESSWTSQTSQDWRTKLESELDNLRSLICWAGSKAEPELGLRAAAALWRFWTLTNYEGEGRLWLQQLLGQPASSEADSSDYKALRAKALSVAGNLAAAQSDFRQANKLLQESLSLYQALQDQTGQAQTLASLERISQAAPLIS